MNKDRVDHLSSFGEQGLSGYNYPRRALDDQLTQKSTIFILLALVNGFLTVVIRTFTIRNAWNSIAVNVVNVRPISRKEASGLSFLVSTFRTNTIRVFEPLPEEKEEKLTAVDKKIDQLKFNIAFELGLFVSSLLYLRGSKKKRRASTENSA